MEQDVVRLEGFGTRHTLSDTKSTNRGIGAASRFIEAEFRRAAQEAALDAALPKIEVVMETHRVEADGRRVDRDFLLVNVVMKIPGRDPAARERHVYVVAHYDSRASDVMNAQIDAPGANDDGSGVAVLLELARVLSKAECDATIVLLATSGEEQGLLGAHLHAQAALEAGVAIEGVLSNDIVGDPTGPDGQVDAHHVRVFSDALPAVRAAAGNSAPVSREAGASNDAALEELERLRAMSSSGDGISRALARYVLMVAAWHGLEVQPMLILRRDRLLRGGDHTAFHARGFAAVRFTEVFENYDRQHQDPRVEGGTVFGDHARFVDSAYLANVARVNAAAAIHLANGPATPKRARVVAAVLESGTTIRWERGSDHDLAGYEVVVRDTTRADWDDVYDAGDATELRLPLSKDNYFFGVRAYDRDGFRSQVAFAGPMGE